MNEPGETIRSENVRLILAKKATKKNAPSISPATPIQPRPLGGGASGIGVDTDSDQEFKITQIVRPEKDGSVTRRTSVTRIK